MVVPSNGSDVWVNTFYGPRGGVLKFSWEEKKKALIEFSDSPELVGLEDCFLSERDCYAAAADKKQREAMAAMQKASEYSRKACGNTESGKE